MEAATLAVEKKNPLSFEEIIKPTATNMWLLGLPLDKDSPVTIWFVLSVVNLFIVLVEEAAFLISKLDSDHFLEATAIAPCIGAGIICISLAFAMSWNHRRIRGIIEVLKTMQDGMTEEELNVKEVEPYWKFAAFLSKIFFIFNQILIWLYNVNPLVLMAAERYKTGHMPWIMPYDVLLPVEIDRWSIFIPAYLQNITAGVTSVIALVAGDSMYFVLTTHICVHFAVLCNKLENLNAQNSHTLVNIIKRHQELIGITEDLEKIFSPALFVNFMMSSIEICLASFNIVAGDRSFLPSFVLFLTSAMTQIFIICMFGDTLLTESERVGQAAYMSEWYHIDGRSKTMITILKERTKRPSSLTAMKFTDMSYATFAKILSSSWSYFTIINTMYSEPDN